MGFSFKLDEYFGVDVLNLPFLQPFALSMAVVIVIVEVLLGVALLLGRFRKLTVWLLLLMILFFTFLTFYSAYFNKVTDCGCFGDAIPLTPWQSFGKDVILTVLILIIFLNIKYIKPILGSVANNVVMIIALIGCAAFGYHVLNHLPVKDFRAYAEGKSIIEGMKPAEEVGKEPTTYLTIYTLKNKQSGEEQTINSEQYINEKWWEKKDWEIQSDKTETTVKKHGYEPPIHDFVIVLDDEDITDQILAMDNVFLVVAYNIEKTDIEGYAAINTFAKQAEAAGLKTYGLSASLPQLVENFRHEAQTPFPFASVDETTLKTIVRSNPGLVWLSNGVVMKKWHHNDVPNFSEVKSQL